MTRLFHYTCADHGRAGIGEQGLIVSGAELTPGGRVFWTATLVWLTDLQTPIRDALGLTSNFTACDRTAFRYEVDAPDAIRWATFARTLSRAQRESVEATPGARPGHWWVSPTPVPATLSLAVAP